MAKKEQSPRPDSKDCQYGGFMSVIGKGVIGTCIKYDLRYGCGKSFESVREIKIPKRRNPGVQ